MEFLNSIVCDLSMSLLPKSYFYQTFKKNDLVTGSRFCIKWVCTIALIFVGCLLAGCRDAEDIFTSGRIENRCDNAIPVCSAQAGCILNSDQFLRGEFPGAQLVIVRSEVEKARLVVRFLLFDQTYPSTMLQVKAYAPGCGEFDEEISKDRNLFDLAGDDGVIEYHLEMNGIGDHLVEFFSDMHAGFLFTIDIEE